MHTTLKAFIRWTSALVLTVPPMGMGQQPAKQLAPPPPPKTTVDTPQATGTWLKEKPLNDLFSILAKRAGCQYFHNAELDSIKVSGNISDEADPVESMQALGLQYGIVIYRKGKTVYALQEAQSKLLPRKEFTYPMRYLRSETDKDQERLIELLKPLTSAEGSIRFEPKTSTIVLYDHDANVELVKSRLAKLDVPKSQVIVEVKILRLSNSRANRLGTDWSATLGKQGLNLNATAVGKLSTFDSMTFSSVAKALSAITGDPAGTGTGTGTGTTDASSTQAGVVVDPITVSAVIRALNDANLATTENGPVIISEDNEPATFNIVDRIPIIEQTVTAGATTSNIATDVRYRIDKSDNNEDPRKSREIGVSVTVTPTLLPDGTVRMKLFPRVATITSFTKVQTGIPGVTNEVPTVSEAKAESTARIPNGYTLLLGGYYQMDERVTDSKVPFLGDLPFISLAFRSKQREKARANIAFLITPTSYDPASAYSTVAQTERVMRAQAVPSNSAYPDNDNPKENEKPNLGTRMRNLFPFGKPKAEPNSPFLSEDEQSQITTRQKQDQERIRKGFRR